MEKKQNSEKNSGAKDFFSQLNKESTLRGSFSSTARNFRRGFSAIKKSGGQFKDETQKFLQPARVETFEEALKRLEIKKEDLPLIHNQILLQLYLTFLIASSALFISSFFIARGSLSSGVLSFVISVACFTNAAQSSIRCFQIRKNQLGAVGLWLSSPGEWLPSRLADLVAMERGDPLKHPVLVSKLALKARNLMFLSSIFLGFGVGLHLASLQLVPLAFVGAIYLLSIGLFFYGCRFSFEVFRRRKSLRCDLLLWIISPTHWIPKKIKAVEQKKNTAEGRDAS